MRESQLDLSAFTESIHDGVLVYCRDRYVFASRRMEAILGYQQGELHGQVLAAAMAANAGRVKYHHINDGHEQSAAAPYEAALTCKDESLRPVEITTVTGRWHGEAAVFFIIRDITERKRSEAALREIETRFRQLTHSIHEVFFVRDLDLGRVIYVSPAYEMIWGRPVSPVHQSSIDFPGHIHPDDCERLRAHAHRRNQNKEGLFDDKYRIVRPDGEVRWIRQRTFPVRDDSGRIYRVAGIAEDITEHTLIAEDLRLSEVRLRQIIDLVPHAIYAKDREGRFLLVNKAKADFYGTTVEKLTGALQHTFHAHEHQVARMLADDQEVLNEERHKLIPREEVIDAGGRRHILQTIKIPFRASKDGQMAVLGVSTDITEHKEFEEALFVSEERRRRSLQFAKLATWEWNLHKGTLYWSGYAAPLFGRDDAAMPSSCEELLAAIQPADRARVEDALRKCRESGQDCDIEFRIEWKDGTVHWLHLSGGIVYDTAGTAIRMLGVIQDTTQRKHAERALVESEQKYRAVMEHASDGILLTSMEGRVFDANRGIEELLGYRREELLGLHVTAICPQDEHASLRAAFNDIETKGSSLYERRLLRKNGDIVDVEVAGTAITYQGEKVAMGIIRDITARRRAEELRIQHAKAQRDTLVREVHHRIKNNLQGVVGLLRQHTTKHPRLREPLEAAIGQVNSMAIVHGLYGRDSSKHIVLCEMVVAICHAAGGLTGKTIEPHVSVKVESPVRVSNEEAVPLALILNELVFNAVKHEHGDDGPARVYVHDEAFGASVCIVTPTAQLPQGFDFMTGLGLGIGLNLVKSLLPPDGCRLRLTNEGTDVIAELQLSPRSS